MSLQSYNPKSPKYLPHYLERYAAEVDDWHRDALSRRAA